MSGRRKIIISSGFQRVQWKSRNSRRGLVNKQIVVFSQKSRSTPSTPSKQAISTEGQQYFDGEPSVPLTLPTSTVRPLTILLLGLQRLIYLPPLVPEQLFKSVFEKAEGFPVRDIEEGSTSTRRSVHYLQPSTVQLEVSGMFGRSI
jgi:hypothetical protein